MSYLVTAKDCAFGSRNFVAEYDGQRTFEVLQGYVLTGELGDSLGPGDSYTWDDEIEAPTGGVYVTIWRFECKGFTARGGEARLSH